MFWANLWRRKVPLSGAWAIADKVHAEISRMVRFFLIAFIIAMNIAFLAETPFKASGYCMSKEFYDRCRCEGVDYISRHWYPAYQEL
jgi:hypothetical protein